MYEATNEFIHLMSEYELEHLFVNKSRDDVEYLIRNGDGEEDGCAGFNLTRVELEYKHNQKLHYAMIADHFTELGE